MPCCRETKMQMTPTFHQIKSSCGIWPHDLSAGRPSSCSGCACCVGATGMSPSSGSCKGARSSERTGEGKCIKACSNTQAWATLLRRRQRHKLYAAHRSRSQRMPVGLTFCTHYHLAPLHGCHVLSSPDTAPMCTLHPLPYRPTLPTCRYEGVPPDKASAPKSSSSASSSAMRSLSSTSSGTS